MGAAEMGDVALLSVLVENGADPAAVSANGFSTPQAYAASKGHKKALAWLMERFGVGPDRGALALTEAARGGHVGIVRLLLDAGVSANAHTSALYGRTALMWAAWQGRADIADLLISRGADVNARESPGRTAISFAAGAGRKRVTRLLLGAGVAPQDKDAALLEALQGGHGETAMILLDGGADPNSVGYHERTALMWAARNGSLGLVQGLLRQGAVVTARDKDGLDARAWAERAGRAEIADLLARGSGLGKTERSASNLPAAPDPSDPGN